MMGFIDLSVQKRFEWIVSAVLLLLMVLFCFNDRVYSLERAQ